MARATVAQRTAVDEGDLKELMTLLAELPAHTRKRCVRPAVAKASAVVARSVAMEGAKASARHAASGAKLSAGHTPLGQTTIIKSGSGKRGKEWAKVGYWAPHAHLVELGHRQVTGGKVPRLNKKKSAKGWLTGMIGGGEASAGRVVGFVRPHPIIGVAWRESEAAMMSTLISEMQATIIPAIGRQWKKQAKVLVS